MDEPFIISFSGTTTAEGNQLASSPSDALLDTGPGISVERAETQDFGATLPLPLRWPRDWQPGSQANTRRRS
jgi:hypothetical protein